MSPTALKLHVTHLVSVLHRCDEICDAIFTNRRVGSKHESLDSLQLGLRSSNQAIQNEYNALRKVFGSRFDLGDDISRSILKSHIRTVEDMQSKLTDIATRRNDGMPGFRDMLRKLLAVEDSVVDSLCTLGQRLDRPVAPPSTSKPAEKKPDLKPKKQEPKPKKASDLVVSIKEWDRYTDHLKNSWFESLVDGRILYVNAFDQSKNTFKMPRGGFIKTLPVAIPKPRTTRIPVFEEPRFREWSPSRGTGPSAQEQEWEWRKANGFAI